MVAGHTDCVEKPISVGFQRFGRFVGRKPWWFLGLPLLSSLALAGGFCFLEEREANDIEEQFTPVDGAAKLERRFVRENFPQDDSLFSSQRLYTDGVYASFIAVSRSANVLTRAAFQEVIRLDRRVKEIEVYAGRQRLSFGSLCATRHGECVSNAILDVINYDGGGGGGGGSVEETRLTFPFSIFGLNSVFLGYSVGGVVRNATVISSAKAIRLFYFLKEEDESKAAAWLGEFLRVFPSNLSLDFIEVTHATSLSRQVEFEANSKDVIPLFSITYVISISFSVVSCLRFDCVRNKVWVAAFGVMSAGLAVLSSFGMMLYVGVPFVMTVANSPFLILGIGVDDMFILISCWQQTNVHDKVEDRLADTYKEAAISITITTLTDVLAFYIGLMTPFRSVRSFCLYTSTAILFCYFYSITFFGAFMVLNGRRENSNRHWLTCKEVPEDCPPGRSKGFSLCCVGGAYDHHNGKEESQPMNQFFKKYYGPFLIQPWTKVFVILFYAMYLATSIYGCFQIKEGIDLRNLAADDSYVVRYYNDEKEFFSEYGPNIMVMVKGEFPYWDKKNRSDLDSCIADFKNLSFIKENMFTSWLETYEIYGLFMNLNLNDERVFKDHLSMFLNRLDFKQDVNFTNNTIYASRFFIQTVNITTAVDEMSMLTKLRSTAEKCPVPLLVYHPAFIYHDQYAVIVSNTIQNIAVTTAVMLFISLLLIPSPLCCLWVTFSIASIIVGVTGFMALWDVNLDTISMIILVVCIGFSVDFTAHISYAFVSGKKPSANEKAVEALFTLGYPIVQGAVSTILGVVVLSASKNYIFRTFFKIMFLVIFFGMFHGITFIPVFLTFFDICSSSSKVSGKEKPTFDEQTTSNKLIPSKQELQGSQVKQIYENHTFLADNNQCKTQQGPAIRTLAISAEQTQTGQVGVTDSVAVLSIDNQIYDVQMCMASDGSVNDCQKHNSDEGMYDGQRSTPDTAT